MAYCKVLCIEGVLTKGLQITNLTEKKEVIRTQLAEYADLKNKDFLLNPKLLTLAQDVL